MVMQMISGYMQDPWKVGKSDRGLSSMRGERCSPRGSSGLIDCNWVTLNLLISLRDPGGSSFVVPSLLTVWQMFFSFKNLQCCVLSMLQQTALLRLLYSLAMRH